MQANRAPHFPSLRPLLVSSGIVEGPEIREGRRPHLPKIPKASDSIQSSIVKTYTRTFGIPGLVPCLWPRLLVGPSDSETPAQGYPGGVWAPRTWPGTQQGPALGH